MTTGREAARDLRYGRRGGRWGNEWTGRVAELLASFDRDRTRARELDRTDPLPPRELDDGTLVPVRRWPELASSTSRRPSTDEEWNGRARMALARRNAGLDLDELDVEALDRIPHPTSSLIPGALFPDSSSGLREPALAPGLPPSGDGSTGSVTRPSIPGQCLPASTTDEPTTNPTT